MKRPAYEVTAHGVAVAEADPGVFMTYCTACSAREGAWITTCKNWPGPVAEVLFSKEAIATHLERVMFELVRPYDLDDSRTD